MKVLGWFLFLIPVSIGFAGISGISPNSGEQGETGLVVTFTLESPPPLPPAALVPTSVTLGTMTGTNIQKPDQSTVVATFDIPAGESPGAKDAVVQFDVPSYTRAGGFTVIAGADAPPSIVKDPRDREVQSGDLVRFRVEAAGSAPLTYQWRVGGVGIPDATNAVVEIASAGPGDAGAYDCVVDNDFGSTTSLQASLTMALAPWPVADDYVVVDTGQVLTFGNSDPISDPAPGDAFAGQDAQYLGNDLNYRLSGDGLTVHDLNTGLTWQQTADRDGDGDIDADDKLNWTDLQNEPAALNAISYGGFNDWRLPNAKELQSILDYTRSPDTTGSAAIDPVFDVTALVNEGGVADYPFYWSSTTHKSISTPSGKWAVYLCFGEAMGFMSPSWLDVHGAGAQRSDPKYDDGTDYSSGHGPQGDAVRIDNFVRCVRAGARAPGTDTDLDGLTDWYEWDYTGSTTGMHAGSDDDLDGATNLEEQNAGTIPDDGNSVLEITHIHSTNEEVVLRWTTELGKTYSLEHCPDLMQGAFTNVLQTGIQAMPPLNVYTDAVMSVTSKGYYRVNVEP